MNSFHDVKESLYLLLESCQLYVITKYKVNGCNKFRPDLPNLFFYFKFMKSAKFPF